MFRSANKSDSRFELSEEDADMNPMTWRREHQVALLVGIILGIILGLLVGFMYEGFHYATVQAWKVESRVRWGILGAFVGACVIFAQRLLRT
jgi:H+/Cl- antiporter ClcA